MSKFNLLHKTVIEMNDGACVATFVYGPENDAGGVSNPVVMLHGNGESHENMARLIEMVAPERVVIAIDSRGHGASTRGTESLSYERLARDVLKVLDELETSKVHVIGFSDGGIVALLLAMQKPERFASLTVLGANLSPAGLRQDFLEAVADDIAELKLEGSAYALEGSETRYPQVELLSLMLEQPHISPFKLKNISCPVAVMIGSNDLVTYDEAYTIAEAIPNSSLTIVKCAGHDLPNEAPERVIQEAAVAIEEAEQNV